MDSKELEYFITIVDKQNLSAAANALFVAQPTLTRYLQRLEEQLGVSLFIRHKKKLILTSAGQQYYQYALKVLSLQKEVQDEFRLIKETDKGTLRIGITPLLSPIILQKTLGEFKFQFPNVEVQITTNNSSTLDNMLQQGNLDLSISMDYEDRPGKSYEIIKRDTMYAILPESYPISTPTVSLHSLSAQCFIFGEKTQRHTQYLNALMKQEKFHPISTMTLNNIFAAASLAMSGYGVSFICGTLLEPLRSCYHLQAVPLETSIPFYIVANKRKDESIQTIVEGFIQILKKNI